MTGPMTGSRFILCCAALAATLGAGAPVAWPQSADRDLARAAEEAEVSDALAALGGALSLTPLRLELPREQSATRLRIGNRSSRNTAVQLRVFEWTQDNGRNLYRPTQAVRLSPAILRLDPEARQVVHVMRTPNAPQSAGEQRYRIVIDQLPDASHASTTGSNTRLQVTLPLFLDREQSAPGRLSAEGTDGALVIRNSGGQTVRLSSLEIRAGSGATGAVSLKPGRYILGDSYIAYDWPSGFSCGSGSGVRIVATIDGETADVPADLSCS